MATYQITRWLDITRMETSQRHTLPSALAEAYAQAYRGLEGQGQLASPSAHRVRRELEVGGDLEQTLRSRVEDHVSVRLTNGATVTITRLQEDDRA